MRFVHAADIHLDSPFTGLADKAGAPVERLRRCTRRALVNLVDHAIDEGIDFVVIAGDLYDGDWPDYHTGLFFIEQMTRLGRAGIPAYVLHGNHDAESRITRRLTMPPNVRRFSAERPQTFRDDDHKVALHGQSFATAAVADNLARAYPPAVRGMFNIGVLHTAAGGRQGHANYAPCSLDDLLAKGYDYWALGHVHAREVLHTHPHVVFPGNLQGRNIRETGVKGFTLVTVEDNRLVAADHVAADVARWSRPAVDVSDCAELADLVARVGRILEAESAAADGRLVIVRLVLTGRTPLHGLIAASPERVAAECRGVAAGVSEDLWIEKVVNDTRPVEDAARAASRPDAFGALIRSAADLLDDEAAFSALKADVDDLVTKLPDDVRHRLFPDGVPDRDCLADVVARAQDMLASRLAEEAPE